MPLIIGGLGVPELLIIFGGVVLLFGAKKLPQLGGAVGESIKNFKKGVKEDEKKELAEAAAKDAKKDEEKKDEAPKA